MKKSISKMFKAIVACLLTITIISQSFGLTADAASAPTIWYCSHVQDIGWMSTVTNGATSGTTGQSKRVEGVQIDLSGVSGGVTYRSHVQDIGWMNWVTNRQTSGTTGQSKRVEAIQIKLTGAAANSYDVCYRVHVQDIGWMNWVSNGQTAGTTGQSKRVEAIQIKLVAKAGNNNGSGSSVLGNAKVQEFINHANWKVGTVFNNSVTGKLPQTKNMGWGCNAYARDFVQYVYGKSLTSGTKYTNISELRAGDVVYVTPQHWMVILERNGNSVDVIHGNWTAGKVCRSTFNINGKMIGNSKTFSYGYHY